jgi:two-component system, OmpR family, alkaline phosphatase synthesis response regulator PhoP
MVEIKGTKTILVVDDELRLREVVRGYLEQAGYIVLLAEDGHAALEQARQYSPDVVVLDILLLSVDGLEVCRRLRTFSDAYVLMLTAKAEEIDRVIGLEVGADDYLTKPFSPRELVARVRALLRRPHLGSAISALPDVPPPQRVGNLLIDYARHEVTLAGAVVLLTPLEFALLTALAAHPGLVFTRARLLEQVWGTDYFGDDHVLDVHIANLRKKLNDDPTNPHYIETVRGIGYRFTRERS